MGGDRPRLYEPRRDADRDQYAISQRAAPSYKRSSRRSPFPLAAVNLGFWVDRDTETDWDFVFVEARTPGRTTGRRCPTSTARRARRGLRVPVLAELHPFLEHYQTCEDDGTCTPNGTTGAWNAAPGHATAYEQWRVDLGAWAGKNVEIAISYASDDVFQGRVCSSTTSRLHGRGSTSFEDDGDTWTAGR